MGDAITFNAGDSQHRKGMKGDTQKVFKDSGSDFLSSGEALPSPEQHARVRALQITSMLIGAATPGVHAKCVVLMNIRQEVCHNV